MDLLERRYLQLNDIDTIVLDEADEMLDMGFAEDIDTIPRVSSQGSSNGDVLRHYAQAHHQNR